MKLMELYAILYWKNYIRQVKQMCECCGRRKSTDILGILESGVM